MVTKQQLQDAIYETISDINKWQNALQLFIKVTGATKGIITLRDRQTAELVIPKDVRQELSSPFVNGFSEEEIHSYITHYVNIPPAKDWWLGLSGDKPRLKRHRRNLPPTVSHATTSRWF